MPICALQDQLPPGDGPLSVPERVGPGCAPQIGPLCGSRLPLRRTFSGELTLPWEEDKTPLYPQKAPVGVDCLFTEIQGGATDPQQW